jgi:hypothetical protein
VSIALTNFTTVIHIDNSVKVHFVKKKIVQIPTEKISTDKFPIPTNQVDQVPASPNLLESNSNNDAISDTNAEDKKPGTFVVSGWVNSILGRIKEMQDKKYFSTEVLRSTSSRFICL